MEFIDTHAHLYVDQFNGDLEAMLARAKDDKISKVVLPNIDWASSQALIDLYLSDTDFFVPMMGLHPCSVNEDYKSELDQIATHFLRHNFASVGEIGLDYYWDTSKIKEQKDAFVIQLGWSKTNNLPVAIHCRDSFDDILEILEKEQDGSLQGVLHCFTGNKEQAQRLIDLGFYLGIGGVLTYKNSGLDKVLEAIDLKHLVLETDAPYLSPVPFRGKRNESAYLIYIAEKLAEVKGCKLEQVAMHTTQNAKDLFGIL
jgi:TatD DNase family protein